VDGNFVMRCVDEPDDIDVVLVLAADWDLSAELQAFPIQRLVEARRQTTISDRGLLRPRRFGDREEMDRLFPAGERKMV
jgi:hypothetical protein